MVCESQITFDSSRTVTLHRVGAVDQLHVVGRLTRGALDLFVTLVADQQDVVVVAGEPLGLLVHLGDQRAGGVDGVQAALRRGLVHGRDTPCAENTTTEPSGTSSVSSTKTTPCSVSVSTTCRLCTISLRT